VKAALFTAIVTAFALDAMSGLDEDPSTQLLRILVEQSTAGQGVDIPQPRPPSSIVTVNSLWFLSIMFSLAATTWAVLSLEWCAFLAADGVRSEDYEETAEKMQRNFEAIRRWKMHIIVGSVPLVLHISIFLFLAGLWLRLRDVNKQLELIVGISSLIIALSYVILTLLPTFTSAPFYTSVSEMINSLVDEIKFLIKLGRFVRRPPILRRISKSLASIPPLLDPYRRSLYFTLRVLATLCIRLLRSTYKLTGPPVYVIWTVSTKILWAITPAFPPGGDPLRELSRLQTGASERNRGFHQRALFRLMNTPLTQQEAKETLKEWKVKHLRGLGNAGQHMDRVMVRLLVSSLSSVLWDGKITEPERPIFDHCTMLLTEEMGLVFHDSKYDPGILLWNSAISERLKTFVRLDTLTPPLPEQKDMYEEYWNKVVRLLWLSPSRKQIQATVRQLEMRLRLIRPALLRRLVRALHAATLTCLMDEDRHHIIDFPLPDFSRWDFSDSGSSHDGPNDDGSNDDGSSHDGSTHDGSTHGGPSYDGPSYDGSSYCLPNRDGSTHDGLDDGGSNDDRSNNNGSNHDRSNDDDQLTRDLDSELSAFLRNLLARFYNTTRSDRENKSPTTIPELVFALHGQENVPPNFQSALRLFITTTWKNDPSVFDTCPSVAHILVASVENLAADSTPDTPDRSKEIAIRLHTIAYGPHDPSESVANLYRGPVKDDPKCLCEFIHATAAMLEAVLAKENPLGVPDWRSYIDRIAMPTIVSPLFFTDRVAFDHSRENPDYRLPYIYSLAIALSRGIVGAGQSPLEVLHLLGTPGEQRGNAANEGKLDPNACNKEALPPSGELRKPVTDEKTLDISTLVVSVLRRTLSRRAEPAITGVELETYLKPITQALRPLQSIIESRGTYSWRTRWKAIYVLVDIRSILPRALTGFEELQTLINDTSDAVRSYITEQLPDEPTRRGWRIKKSERAPRKRGMGMGESAPSDWKMKKDRLVICGLEGMVKNLAKRNGSTEGVYIWTEPGSIPYLSLYPQRTRYDHAPQAPYRWLEILQK